MRPNDENGNLPPDQRPFRVFVISASQRRQYNCPGVDSKSRMLMLRMADRLPQEWEIDYEDLGKCGSSTCTRGSTSRMREPSSGR
jgi:hypothetical protein